MLISFFKLEECVGNSDFVKIYFIFLKMISKNIILEV